MHTDDRGVVHPLVLAVEVESADVHYASCSTCGSRWAGPFGTAPMAAKVAESANASACYELPSRVRPRSLGLCHGPDGLPVGTPGAFVAPSVPRHMQLGQAADDLGKALVFAGYVTYTALHAVTLFAIGAARFVAKLGAWGAVAIGAVALAAHLGLRRAAPYVPDPATSAHVLLGAIGVLAAVGVVVALARSLSGSTSASADAEAEDFIRTGYPTPLTTARGASSVSPVSKNPG